MEDFRDCCVQRVGHRDLLTVGDEGVLQGLTVCVCARMYLYMYMCISVDL